MTNFARIDRGRIAPTRRAMAFAGAGTIAFSLVLSIGPVLGASGTVKIHHAGSGDDAGNSPHVCAFYAAFYTDTTAETGSWQLIDWDDAGRPVVEDGTYDTSGDGVDTTPELSPPAGHYRLEWLPTGDPSKHKMLWVDEDCAEEEESDPSQEQSPSQESDPSQEQEPSEEQSPSQEPDPSQDSDPSQEPDPSQESDPSQGANPSDEVGPGEESTNPPVEQDVQSGTSGGGSDVLPDTAIPVTESGVLATIGLLLILAAHAGSRRERQLPAT
jgi:hypothetical protein